MRVSTLSDLVARHGALEPADLEWLHLLVGDWQVVSDLAFADLVLWLPTTDDDFVAIAQCRPSTGATVHYDDVVGSHPPEGQRAQLRRALDERAQCVLAGPGPGLDRYVDVDHCIAPAVKPRSVPCGRRRRRGDRRP